MLSFFLAKRIYGDSGETRKVSLPAVRIATLGMAIGLAVMIVSVAVVIGFKHTIRDKVVGFGSHVVVQNFASLYDINQRPICYSDSLASVLKKAPGIKQSQRVAMKQGLLKTDDDFLGVMFKGVAEEWDSTFIHNSMVEGSIPKFRGTYSAEAAPPQILISKMMADKLALKVGDKVFSYFIGNSVRTRRYTVAGIYQTNLSKFDELIVFCDLHDAQRLNGWEDDQIGGIEITVNDFDNLMPTAKWLIKNINRRTDKYGETYSSATIQEQNPQIFQWLDLLDFNVWIILILMVCVASFTMISGLLIIMLERVPMIGILKAMGGRNDMIRHTFLWFGMFIIAKGLVIGNILGIGICLIQQMTGLIKLNPETYYVSEVPVEFNIPVIVVLNLATLLICTLVLVLPSYFVSHIQPSKTMKFGE